MAKDLKGKKLPKGISQRPNGLYMGRVQVNNETHTIYDRSLSELKKKMTELRYQLEHGIYVKQSKMTVDDFFKEWIVYKESRVKAGTLESYQKIYSAYIKVIVGKKLLPEIRTIDIDKIYRSMIENGKSEKTLSTVAAVLSGMFKYATINRMINTNPVPLVEIPRKKAKQKKEYRVFTKEEQDLFMKYSEKSCIGNLFQLAIYSGMRNGELRGLQWSDIDFKNRIIHVNHTLVTITGKGHVLDAPKTKTSKRDIPMIDKAYELLKQQEKEYKRLMGNVAKFENDDFVFCNPEREPISEKMVTAEIDRMILNMADDKIDFKYFTLHATRHTFATRCIEAGMEPQVLKTILGHSSLAMTMDLYSHVLPNTKKESMQKVANMF